MFPFGHAEIDARLSGGLARGRVHEIYASDTADAGSATGFAAMLALCAQAPAANILWLRSDTRANRLRYFYAPGFAELGGDPGSVIVASAPDDDALLRALGDASRCAGLAAIVAESAGDMRGYTLTASRKLALTVEKSGVPLLLLRPAAEPCPSAAETRWAVRAAPSTPFAANAPGHATLDIELLRRRTGPASMKWRVEWNRDQRIFREPSLSGDLVPVPVGESAENPSASRLRLIA